MNKNIWQLQDAKSKFSKLVDSAIKEEPQFVTKHGRNAVVVLSFEDYKKMVKPKQDLVSFLRSSPLAEEELILTRDKNTARDIEL